MRPASDSSPERTRARSLRAARQRDVEPVVHQEALAGGAARGAERTREVEERVSAEVLLAEVERGRTRRQARQRGESARHQIGGEPPIGDQVDNRDLHP